MVTRVEYWQVRKPAVVGDHGVVTAQHWAAAKAGATLLAAGGNAIDAAVAAAMALNTVEPWMSGMGGSGFMVVHRVADASQHAFEFQGTVPFGIDSANYPLDPGAPPVLMGVSGLHRQLQRCRLWFDQHSRRGRRPVGSPGAIRQTRLGRRAGASHRPG